VSIVLFYTLFGFILLLSVRVDAWYPPRRSDLLAGRALRRACLCTECLNAHWFMSLDDARRKCEAWRRDYNAASYCPSSMSLMQIDLGLDSDVLRGPIGDCGHGRRGVWRPQLREPNA